MAEQELEIITKGDYKNIELKSNLAKGKKGLEDGNHVVVTKADFVSGKAIPCSSGDRTWTAYLCGVEYKGEKVTFFLSEAEHAKYAETGGLNDSVKITLNKVPRVNPKTGAETLVQVLSFDLVGE